MKIIERVVEATHEPNKNDLWLKPGEGGSATLNRYAGGQWHPIGGSSESGSGSGCDCDMSNFIQVSDVYPIIVAPNESFTVTFVSEEDQETYNIAFIPDERIDIRDKMVGGGSLLRIKLVPSQNSESGDAKFLQFDYNAGVFTEDTDQSILVFTDKYLKSSLFESCVPDGFSGWGVVIKSNHFPLWRDAGGVR